MKKIQITKSTDLNQALHDANILRVQTASAAIRWAITAADWTLASFCINRRDRVGCIMTVCVCQEEEPEMVLVYTIKHLSERWCLDNVRLKFKTDVRTGTQLITGIRGRVLASLDHVDDLRDNFEAEDFIGFINCIDEEIDRAFFEEAPEAVGDEPDSSIWWGGRQDREEIHNDIFSYVNEGLVEDLKRVH